MGSARHVIKRILTPRFLTQMASYDVASTRQQPHFDPSSLESNGSL